MVGSLAYTLLIAACAVIVWPHQLGGPGAMSIVSGHSMDPTYATGDFIYAWHGTPRVGDIIIYTPDGGLGQIVHRVVGGNATDGYVMQGDNNAWVDPFKPKAADVVGIVRIHAPSAGKLAALATNPLAWGAFILVGLGLMYWPTDDSDDTPQRSKPRGRRATP